MLHLLKNLKKKVWDNIYIRSICLHIWEIAVCLGLLLLYSPYIPKELSFLPNAASVFIVVTIVCKLLEEICWFANK
ncbi:MAG: hypothetical protein E6423_02185 [Clostridium sp.]|nr:hypothetical protein [Clostridium sp.]